jgi:ankyrin repeat protein
MEINLSKITNRKKFNSYCKKYISAKNEKSGWEMLTNNVTNDQHHPFNTPYAKTFTNLSISNINKFKNSDRLLYNAVNDGNIFEVYLLVKLGVYVDVKPLYCDCPLSCAIKNNNIEIIKYLISSGAWIDAKYLDSPETPLRIAVMKNYIEAVKILVNSGADINSTNLQNETPLFAAVKNENIEMVKYLLGFHSDITGYTINVNLKNSSGYTPLWFAARSGNLEIVDLLIKTGATRSSKNDEYNPLTIATENNHTHVITRLKSMWIC